MRSTPPRSRLRAILSALTLTAQLCAASCSSEAPRRGIPDRIPDHDEAIASEAPRRNVPDRINGPDEAIAYVGELDNALYSTDGPARGEYTVALSPDSEYWIVVVGAGFGARGYGVDRHGNAWRVQVANGSCAMPGPSLELFFEAARREH